MSEPANMSTGERLLVAAIPLVTLGLGYPPYSALMRWRICETVECGLICTSDSSRRSPAQERTKEAQLLADSQGRQSQGGQARLLQGCIEDVQQAFDHAERPAQGYW